MIDEVHKFMANGLLSLAKKSPARQEHHSFE